jgi:hypothetical protein
MQAQILQTMQ